MYYNRYYMVDSFKPKSVEFDVWSSSDIKQLSVAKINTYISFDNLEYPIAGGLHDTRLGPVKFTSDPCATCGNNLMKCTGHFGHIELPLPVYNPLFIAAVANILRITCLHCHTITIPEVDKCVLTTQLKLIDAGFLIQPSQLDEYLSEIREENKVTGSCKPLKDVQNDMKVVCDQLDSNSSTKALCKNTGDVWRYYINKIFRGRSAKTCVSCQKELVKITFTRGRLYVASSEKNSKKEKEYLTPMAAMEHLRKLWRNEKELLKTLIKPLSDTNEQHPTDLCFISAVLVTPSNTRPVQVINKKQIEHPKNSMYRPIIQDCMQIRGILQVMNEGKAKEPVDKEVLALVNASRGQTINEKLHNAWFSLQRNVDALLDANALKGVVNLSIGTTKIGLKQLIEKKAGILRKNMMGKRVDYFARSVVTPDPLLNVYEIGVPELFAKKLTFPVPVTPWNVSELRQLVLNGPNVYPGANIVEADDGSVVWVSGTSSESRKGLAKTLLTPKIDSSGPKVVHRHLVDGDMLLINRQPSLHKPSIMAHKARVLKGEKTFRLHYANCKAYNADFDGDEMNAHFPQGQLARAEASEIVNVAHQYLVPRDGTPLSGLIQDHVISGFRLSIRDRFFERWQYHQLVFQALCFFRDDIKLLPPAILKPQRLWTGKQIISTIVVNLTPPGNVPVNLNSKTKLAYNAWPTSSAECEYMTRTEREQMSETNVVIRKGELLVGVLDKNHVGATHYGLVHSFYELYGGQHSANLLSAFSKLFTCYLQKDGFTLGVADILVRHKANRKRDKIALKAKTAGIEAAKNALDIPAEEQVDEEELRRRLEIAYKKNSNFRALIDREYKTVLDRCTNDINKVCLPGGLLRLFPDNNLQLMVASGAKGSTVNTMQISCLLGQIELEGKRPPLMISGKSLPCFRPYDTSPMAGGFITSRFMTGIRPQEFFFHCMAGREGLIDTAVKTSRSGYLQRCLVKHLEGLIVHYDLTVRDSDSSVIQFRYGEDGLDISKSQLLKPTQLKFVADNIDALYDKANIKVLKTDTAKSEIKRRKAAISAFIAENESISMKKRRDGPFLRFCQDVGGDVPPMPPRTVAAEPKATSRTKVATNLCRTWQEGVHDSMKIRYAEMCNKYPDPVTADYAPDVHFGSVSENIENMLHDYLKTNRGNVPTKKSKFKDAIYWKSFASLCQPGEAVGVLAAQSVGEPSTQMTLNTFHFAGRGEMNVTLGIPRLREILMVASKRIKTPSMEIPFKTDVPKLAKKAEKLRKSLTRMVLQDVLEKIDVRESIHVEENRIRKYQLKLHYLPRKCYSNMTNITPGDILKYAEGRFLVKLDAMLKKHLKSNYSSQLVTDQKETTKREVDEADDAIAVKIEKDDSSDPDSDVEGDGDATEAKFRGRHADAQEYDDEIDSENEDNSDEDNDDENIDEKSIKLEPEECKEECDNDSDAENDTSFKSIKLEPAEEVKEEYDSDSDDENDTSLNATKMKDKTPSYFKTRKRVNVAKKYGILSIKHDEVGMSWSKIVLWTSLSYKRLDLSALLPREAETAVIHEIPGIKRAITYLNNDGLLTLKTEGSYGIWELFKHDRLLDLDKLYSNDVQAVAQTYGIEAANRVIVREVQDVFQVYGITVDPRHLLLIADYMTFNGSYQALNRTGMDDCPSPLQQMTFESTLKYIKNATVRKLKDNLRSPSSSLIVGQEPKIGSGLISCLEPINVC